MNHSKFQALSIGHTHRSEFWSVLTDPNFVPDLRDLDPSNGLLAMAKLFASSACYIFSVQVLMSVAVPAIFNIHHHNISDSRNAIEWGRVAVVGIPRSDLNRGR